MLGVLWNVVMIVFLSEKNIYPDRDTRKQRPGIDLFQTMYKYYLTRHFNKIIIYICLA